MRIIPRGALKEAFLTGLNDRVLESCTASTDRTAQT